MLILAVCILGILVYEVHNAPGRYVQIHNSEGGGINNFIDTATGKIWYYKGNDDGWVQTNTAIPNRSHSID